MPTAEEKKERMRERERGERRERERERERESQSEKREREIQGGEEMRRKKRELIPRNMFIKYLFIPTGLLGVILTSSLLETARLGMVPPIMLTREALFATIHVATCGFQNTPSLTKSWLPIKIPSITLLL